MTDRNERRQEDISTRDIALTAKQKVDSHMEDCVAARIRVENAFASVNTRLEKMSAKQDKIGWLLGLIIGGLILVREAIELYVQYKK